ncbi:ABC transporter permease [Agrobacterium fabrum]|uniref:ABC transporter permease n=1 Tax=Agrobacterium fabrum TaxID=1176649 RepID=UPI0015736D55|nr:ABC transporter permease [Agrobacterium fabrum]WCK80082.1 ABC transporter permease [Agrobacterium fabrum]
MSRLNSRSRLELLVVPALVLVIVSTVVPLVGALVGSVYRNGGVSFDYYAIFLNQKQYVWALSNTLIIAGATTVLCVVLAFPACAFFAAKGSATATLFIGAMGLSFAISGLIRTISWNLVLGRGGPLDDVLSVAGIGSTNLLYTRAAVIIGTTQIMFPYAAAILFSGMRRVDRDILLAASTLGAGSLQTFRTAYWPQVQSSVVSALLLIFVLSTGTFVTPALLGGPGDSMLGNIMHNDLTHNFEDGVGLASAAGTVLTVILGSVALAFALLFDRSFHRRAK